MSVFPTTLAEAAGHEAELRAGGTDLQARRRHHRGPLVDLRDVPGLDSVTVVDGALQIGARVTLAKLARSELAAPWSALVAAAGGLATPAIRNVGTVGGNLLQRNRCWYYRNPLFNCFKSGGPECKARTGDAEHHALIDQGACIAPHPSTLAVALIALQADALVFGADPYQLSKLYHAENLRNDHVLAQGALLTGVRVPAPVGGSGWVRVEGRAGWPAVEAVAALELAEGRVVAARVVLGGVANTPLRLASLEATLVGAVVGPESWQRAGSAVLEGRPLLSQASWKLPLARHCVAAALAAAVEAG